MSTNSEANKRIVRNTMLLYIRMGVMMIISFFTARITLEALGVVDYGINNVVGGLVSMFSLISSSLSSSVSRFITFGLGKGDKKELNTIFSTSVNIHVILAVIVVIAIETIGIWFLNNKMVIPAERLTAAHWVLQCSTFMFALGLLSTPYNAAIIAHERMDVYAYFTLFDAFSRLAIVFSIKYYGGDKLILLAIISLIPSLIKQFYYWHFSKRNFEECTYHAVWDKKIFKEMFSFAGWNFFGNSAYILNTQGVNMLINLFFGVTLNAARGIATQIEGIVGQFVGNFTIAINPQITKSYAAKDLDYMFLLIKRGAIYSSYIMLIIIVPIIMEMRSILTLWLGEIPPHTVTFTRLTLCSSLVIALGNSLLTAILASGKIKKYQIIITLSGMWVFPLTYIAFKLGMPAESAYIIYLTIYIILIFIRAYLAQSIINLNMWRYVKDVILKVICVSITVSIVPIIITHFTDECILRTFIASPIVFIITIGIIYTIGFEKDERKFVNEKIKHIIKRVRI